MPDWLLWGFAVIGMMCVASITVLIVAAAFVKPETLGIDTPTMEIDQLSQRRAGG